ncbi:lactate utilization protein B/C [Formosa sp. Hel1_33_131]|jgi:L-lactate utilization protein LutB|uniref:LUD domain-containing protein n=1 Tax=Formosa sp. Hel1_33_131 TaxID=1336794 RepID=UPI00084E3677|nr:LUD domain-containing protein [Formosa sp. Hel1_33_131]AOR27622.1 lactate utilization protein B/C [Formosa sp. Hel1_33_131]
MSVFRKIFGSKTDASKDKTDEKNQDQFLDSSSLPVDEAFTINFNKNGGKFLYCENNDEVQSFLENIIEENNWDKKKALILNKHLKEKFKSFKFGSTQKTKDADFLFTSCESLIAKDGSLLISSNQIAEKKLVDLPENFIVFATTSQFVNTISEGLQGIKAQSKTKIPSNITTIKHFKANDTNDFLSYGSSTKNLYLLLLEDL